VTAPSPAETSFEEIARLIAPSAGVPPWLPTYLRNWAPSLLIDRHVHAMQPKKTKMKRRMKEIQDAAAVLLDMLGDVPTKEFLEIEGRLQIENVGGLEHVLKGISGGAKIATESLVSTATGATKPGRGKALPRSAISPKAFCALIVAEAWAHLHADYPAPRNQRAAAAAQALWQSVGGTTSSWGSDPLTGWSYYFTEARSEAAESLRKETRRHCVEHAHRETILGDAENNRP
jgi:hypothetical protein